jgi:hypothetical protein
MQVQFNRPATIRGVTYGKGQHAVPDDAKGDWFLEALVKDGDAVVLRSDDPVENKPQTVVQADWPSMDETAQAAPDILDSSTKDISVAIEGLSAEELQGLLAREQAGKARKSVVKLLEEAIGDA